jgi:hypothetical protein
MIDEEAVRVLCDQLESTWDERQRLSLLDRIDAVSRGCAHEKKAILRGLYKRKRIPNASAHRSDICANIEAIRTLCRIQNRLAADLESERQKFRVEIPPPWRYPESGDFVFQARVYIDGRFRSSIACIVTEADVDSCRIANRSLSKIRTRMRKIDENIRLWEQSFSSHIEKLWASGAELSAVATLRLSDTR